MRCTWAQNMSSTPCVVLVRDDPIDPGNVLFLTTSSSSVTHNQYHLPTALMGCFMPLEDPSVSMKQRRSSKSRRDSELEAHWK